MGLLELRNDQLKSVSLILGQPLKKHFYLEKYQIQYKDLSEVQSEYKQPYWKLIKVSRRYIVISMLNLIIMLNNKILVLNAIIYLAIKDKKKLSKLLLLNPRGD